MEEVLPWILDRLHHIGLSPDAESLATGLLCGDKSLMTRDALQDVRDAGMSHLLAVSGLHIGLIWALLWFLFRYLLLIPYYLRRDTLPWTLGIRLVLACVLWLYVWMIGAPPSAVRAALMISIAQLSVAATIDCWRWENLITAALIMLCYEPALMADVGFQLSFAAMAGIYSFRGMMNTHEVGRKQYEKPSLWERTGPIRSLLWLSFSAQLFTIPLVAYYFHHLPLLGWIQGLLVVPMMALLLYLILFLMLFPATWGMMVIFGNTVYHWLSLPVEALSWWFYQVAHCVSRLEIWMVGGRVEFYPSIGETILLELIIVGLTWSTLGLLNHRRQPSTQRRYL